MYIFPILSQLYLFWWLPKVENMLLYDRRQKYWSTLILSTLNVLAVSWGIGIVASVFATPFVGLPVGFIVLFWLVVKYGEEQAYKCPQCACVDNVKYLGEFDGGIATSSSNDVNQRREERSDGLDEITVRTRRKDYYQRVVRVFACNDCNHQWQRTHRGNYLGSDITKKTTTKEHRW